MKERIARRSASRPVERQWGGAYAIARHLAQVCGTVTLAGIAAGGELDRGPQVPAGTPDGVEREFDHRRGARTIVKQRYVVENKLREELAQAVRRCNHLPEMRRRSRPSRASASASVCPDVDADSTTWSWSPTTATVCSTRRRSTLLQERARYLALNCQTNSSNFGFNLITKYRRADAFGSTRSSSPGLPRAEHRARNEGLSRARSAISWARAAGWLTLGAAGAIGANAEGAR